ncbi:MAG TPA: LLM class F420-dependent oxidoreductase [Thermomicrobiaceae bacterium]|nr:LLM class F420-dependent oxidoreductase [Thermomicrobiaceae bacterium]
MSIPFGVFVPQGWRLDLVDIPDPVEKYEAMTQVARVAEDSGFDSVWLYDHFLTVPTIELETTFECWTTTAALTRDTHRVKVGQMVTCNGYRNPALLAKMASTVDVMSHGRLLCGLGAGWYEAEWRAYGYGFPPLRDRMQAFAEACELIHRMWTEDHPAFHGRHYTIEDAINEPHGPAGAHPRLWIGGSGERVTLRLVARWGDACNVGGEPDVLRHKFDVLRRHCEDVGRDYDQIVRSSTVMVFPVQPGESPEQATAAARRDRPYEEFAHSVVVGTGAELVERLQQRVDAGVNYLILYVPGVAYDHDRLRLLATEVLPHVTG